ncbi:MAG: hypothetical protein D6744_17960, partial [Planctomycetota bacterium]
MNEAQDLHSVSQWLAECGRPLLVSHRRPDGDALGSLAGVAHELTRRGVEPLVALYEPFPRRYAIIENACRWRQWEQ